MKRQSIVLSSLLLIPFIVGSRDMWSGEGAPDYAATESAQPTSPVDRRIHGIGYVEPAAEVRRLVFKVDGVVARCPAVLNEAVRAGTVLMELDNRKQDAAVAVAEEELRLAEAERDKVLSGINPAQIDAASRRVELLREQFRFGHNEHVRARDLIARKAMSRSEYDKAFTEMTQRRAELRQAESDQLHLQSFVREEDRRLAAVKVQAAQARLSLAREQREDTLLRAPCDGTTLEILKREGEGSRVSDTEPVILFADLSRLRVRAEVDERHLSDLTKGQSATVAGSAARRSGLCRQDHLDQKDHGKENCLFSGLERTQRSRRASGNDRDRWRTNRAGWARSRG